MGKPKPFDVIALLEDLPSRGLRRRHVGTALQALVPRVFEVEFSDNEGRTYATAPLRSDQLVVLNYNPSPVP